MNYGNYFKYCLSVGKIKNLLHCFDLNENDKRENYVKSYHYKSYYLDPEKRLKKIDKI